VSRDKSAKIWDVTSGQELFTLSGHTNTIFGVAFSSDGKRVATASADKTAKIWDAKTGELLNTLTGHTDFVNSVAFSPDDKRLATASWDKTARVWDAISGKELFTLAGFKDDEGMSIATRILSMTWLLAGMETIATGSRDNTAKVWSAATGDKLLSLHGHDLPLRSIAFSPDGKRIATTSDDMTAKLWDATSGRELVTLRGHKGLVSDLVFSADGKRVATTSWDKTAKLWDALTGMELYTLSGHEGDVNGVVFIRDGKYLATASDDQTVRIYAQNIDDLTAIARRRVTRALTSDECKKYLAEQCSKTVLAIGGFVEGKNHALAGDTSRAISSFEEALKLDPTLNLDPKAEVNRLESQALAEKAMNFYWQGKYKEAIGNLEKALSLDSKHIPLSIHRFYADLADKFRRKKDFDNAFECAGKAMKANPDYGYAYIVLGYTKSDMGDIESDMKKYEDAVAAFSKVKKSDPEYITAITQSGTICFDRMHKYEPAYEYFKRALELNRNDLYTIANFAEANVATGRLGEAYNLAQRALSESGGRLGKGSQLAMMNVKIVSSSWIRTMTCSS
jgi:tetratricopeptide (TPR) repeat protein